MGYGPRFLHSTGQLHKGDAGKGLFVQILSPLGNDVPIPDHAGSGESSISFGTLITAQAFGDRRALLEKNRRVITLQLSGDEKASFSDFGPAPGGRLAIFAEENRKKRAGTLLRSWTKHF